MSEVGYMALGFEMAIVVMVGVGLLVEEAAKRWKKRRP